MLTRLLERINKYLPSVVQACPPAALNDNQVDRALRLIRSIEGTLAALKVKLAGARAVRRGHGDGGASTLKELGGMSEWQARRSVATAKTLGQMREVQDAVEDGHISADNAARLARAARKVSPRAVESDDGLLSAAQRYAADDFDKAASRWEQAHQNDGGMGEHLRNRRRRFLQFWTQHGMVHFKGRTDLVSGTAIRRRLERLAQQLRQQDAKTAPIPGNGTGPQPGRLTFGQAMLDALDTTTDSNPASVADSNPARVNIADSNPARVNIADSNPASVKIADSNSATANIADLNTVATADLKTGKSFKPDTDSKHNSDPHTASESEHDPNPNTEQPSACPASRSSGLGNQRSAGRVGAGGLSQGGVGLVGDDDPSPVGGVGCKSDLGNQRSANSGGLMGGFGDQDSVGGVGCSGGLGLVGGGRGDDSGSGMPKAEVVVVMDLMALLGDDNARCEIPAVGPIPAAIARRLAAANGVVPILLDGDGEPLRHGGRKRLATRAQWQALIARDGACIGCGGDPLRCEAHHDPPFSKTGRTWIEELALLCYECHHKVHDQKWQIVLENGQRVLQPPDTRPVTPRRNQAKVAESRQPVSVSTSDTYQPPMLC